MIVLVLGLQILRHYVFTWLVRADLAKAEEIGEESDHPHFAWFSFVDIGQAGKYICKFHTVFRIL
jgi:hypothetical protein